MRIIVLLLFLAAAAVAEEKAQSNGYVLFAPGAVSAGGVSYTTIHMGGGGELALPKAFGAGLELGAVAQTRAFRDTILGVASANGYYHIQPGRWRTLDPFGTVGYSLFFRGGTANAVNYGGGFNYWFHPPLGVRVEFRDHRLEGGAHFWGFRFALSFTELMP